MLEKEELIKTLQDICENYSDIIGMVILFGSYSRNEATDNSDIDLYVEPREKTLTTTQFGKKKRFKDFKYTLYETFSKNFDFLSYGGKKDISTIRKSSIWKQIEKDGVLIYDKRAEAV